MFYFNVLYNNIDAVLQINGWLSDKFDIGRGVKQGCALSCCLFVMCIDPLLRNVDANSSIKGFKVNDQEVLKLLCYADDVAAVVSNRESVEHLFKEYERLYNFSGLRLNSAKTECLHLGPNSTHQLSVSYLGESVQLNLVNQLKICGSVLSKDRELSYFENVSKRIEKISSILQAWRCRNLSPNGKMIILKTFALSQIVFVSQFMNISSKDVKNIESICYKFVWSGKPDRIKRSALKNEKLYGGINAIDVDCFLRAIKIKQFVKADAKCSALRYIQSRHEFGEEIASTARVSIYSLQKFLAKGITFDSLINSSTEDKICYANLNILSLIKPGSKTEHIIRHYDIDCFAKLLDTNIQRAKMNQVIRNIPTSLRPSLVDDYEYRPVRYGLFNGIKIIYLDKCPTAKLQSLLKTCYKKCTAPRQWLTDVIPNWKGLWRIKNPALRTIRFKIAHGDVFSKSRRFKCKLVDNDKCDVCGETETVAHQILECPNAIRLWQPVLNLLGIEGTAKTLIECNQTIESEIAIAVIFKLLCQIDRSRTISADAALHKIKYYLILEKMATKNYIFTDLISRINNFLGK